MTEELRAETSRANEWRSKCFAQDRLKREAFAEIKHLEDLLRALHYPAYNDVNRTPLCENCHGKAGVHECGCWSEDDYEPVCGHCYQGYKGMSVPYPCPTIRTVIERKRR